LAALVAAGRDALGNILATAFSPLLFGLYPIIAIIPLLAAAPVQSGRKH